MANFKVNRTPGRCEFCGRKGEDHCTVSYPINPKVPESRNTKKIRICGDCGLLASRVTTERVNWMRDRKNEKSLRIFLDRRSRQRGYARLKRIRHGITTKTAHIKRSET